jgi:hypothetical protein
MLAAASASGGDTNNSSPHPRLAKRIGASLVDHVEDRASLVRGRAEPVGDHAPRDDEGKIEALLEVSDEMDRGVVSLPTGGGITAKESICRWRGGTPARAQRRDGRGAGGRAHGDGDVQRPGRRGSARGRFLRAGSGYAYQQIVRVPVETP